MNKNKIIRGTHNSMSYLPVKNPLMQLPNLLFARCQKKNIFQQYQSGCKVFDIRIWWNKKTNYWEYRHGVIKYKPTVKLHELITILNAFAKESNDIYVRLLLEYYEDENDISRFIAKCEELEKDYPNINFICGRCKKGWKQLYKFKNDIDDSFNNQFVSSMTKDARWYEKFMPFAYAKRMNKVNITKMKPILNLFDFM